jgi:integrase
LTPREEVPTMRPEVMMSRRSWGSIYQRPDSPRWYIRYPSGTRTASGRTSYVVRAVGTKKEAKAALKELRKRLLVGELRPPTRSRGSVTDTTLATAIEEYKRTLGRTKDHGIGGCPVTSLDTRSIEQFLATLENLAPASVRGHLATISASLNRLVKQDRLDENPAAQIRPPKAKTAARAVLNRTEVGKLLDACEPVPQLRTLVLAGLFTGARLGELLDLRWCDVDFERRVLVVRRSKTGNVGTIRIHPTLEPEIRAHRTRLGRIPDARERIFPPLRGGSKRWRMDKLIIEAFDRAGIRRPGVCFHALRNTFATRYLEAGGNPRNLQALLGHSQLRTTEVYLRTVDEVSALEVEAVDVGVKAPEHTRSVPVRREGRPQKRRKPSA